MEIPCARFAKPLLNNFWKKRCRRDFKFFVIPFCRKLSTVSPHVSESDVERPELSHTPVMLKEVIEALKPQDNGVYLDMTFGSGGHSRAILESAANIRLYCLDRDPVAYEYAKNFAEIHREHVIPLLGRFSELGSLLKDLQVSKNSVDGILIDAGCSSMQYDEPDRGFSISKNGPLDMRMDGKRFPSMPTAADVVNTLDYPSLVKIFKTYGEEKHSKKLAQALIDVRFMLKKVKTTQELAELVSGTLECNYRLDKLQRRSHAATKIFQAIRIFVNNELNELNYGIETAHSYLKPNGRLVVLTFHSLEDRIVKRKFHDIDIDEPVSHTLSQKYANASYWYKKEEMCGILEKKWLPLYKSVFTPTEGEILSNPRSRSAKLRFASKVACTQKINL